jgi:hypothetical protein
MEITFMNTTAHSANLSALLSSHPEVCSLVGNAMSVFQKTLKQDDIQHLARMFQLEKKVPFTLQAHWLSSTEQSLLQAYISATYDSDFQIASWRANAMLIDHIYREGLEYARKGLHKHDGNSNVCFSQPGGDNHSLVGAIQTILEFFLPTGKRMSFLVVQEYTPASLDFADPYRRYTRAGALFSESEKKLVVIEPNHLLYHCGVTPITYGDQALIHVLPVSKVML